MQQAVNKLYTASLYLLERQNKHISCSC